jgi:hypothetical protein
MLRCYPARPLAINGGEGASGRQRLPSQFPFKGTCSARPRKGDGTAGLLQPAADYCIVGSLILRKWSRRLSRAGLLQGAERSPISFGREPPWSLSLQESRQSELVAWIPLYLEGHVDWRTGWY